MPKQVDHTARRLELLEAMMRITRTHGWDGVSLRKLAAEAGVSMGMVQHYFTTKDEMLRFAIEMMAEDTRQRIRDRTAALPEPRTPRQLAETLLTEMIPNPRRRAIEAEGVKVWIRRFLLRPDSQATLHEGATELRTALTNLIFSGRPGDKVDAQRDADTLIALLDGLIYHIVIGQQTAETATAILTTQLDHIFR
ncbi:MAG: TetR family transcriptional regulator [Mycobacterium sp.]|nr:TetR family transcriptional regulator [Mycobacterium sp.]